ncbi:MAG: hypothetical protein V8Q43_01975 [Christensenellaceae bacterium]
MSDGYEIRRCAVENNVTMFTSLDTVRVLLDVLEEITLGISTIDAGMRRKKKQNTISKADNRRIAENTYPCGFAGIRRRLPARGSL